MMKLLNLFLVIVCVVGVSMGDVGAPLPPGCPPIGPQPPPRPCPRCHCRPRTWRRVTMAMIESSYKLGVKISHSQVNGGLVITGTVYNYGCGSPGSGAVTYIKGDWTQIRYTQEFHGKVSCWKIFGGAAYPKFRSDFAFYPNPLQTKPTNNVEDFSASLGDGIFNEYRMNSISKNAFDGRVYRCDNEKSNFWHGKNGQGLRRATVMLRRSSNKGKAGIMTETSCGKPTYVIKDIWVLM